MASRQTETGTQIGGYLRVQLLFQLDPADACKTAPGCMFIHDSRSDSTSCHAATGAVVTLLVGVTSAVGGQAEKGQARWQAMDLHRDRSRDLPVGAAQAESAGQGRAGADEVPLDAVVAVAEFAGDPQ